MCHPRYTLLISSLILASRLVVAGVVDDGKSVGAGLAAGGQGAVNDTATFSTVTGHGTTDAQGGGNSNDRGHTSTGAYAGRLSCRNAKGTYLGGIGLRVESCNTQGDPAAVQSMQVSTCTAPRGGNVCGPGDWSSPINFTPHARKPVAPGFELELTDCPVDGYQRCEALLHETDSNTWNGEKLGSEGSAAANGQNSGYQQLMVGAYNDPAYRASLDGVGTQYGGCVNQVNTNLNGDGLIYSCDGSQSAQFDSECEDVRECLRTETVTNNWTASCNANVPIYGRSCNRTDETGSCTTEYKKADFDCSNSLQVDTTQCHTTRNTRTIACEKELQVTVVRDGTVAPSCTPGTYTNIFSGTRDGYSWDTVAVDVYCEPNRTDGKFRFRFRETSAYYHSTKYHNLVIPPPSSSAYTLVSTAPFNGNHYDYAYYKGSCNGFDCSLQFKFGNSVSDSSKARGPFYRTARPFTIPHTSGSITVTEEWVTRCPEPLP